ncbi:MAG: LysR family transcriptional regulator, partial [Gammaproteobacteria bacterium]|nr:LysR family transcriptional regulator [Gammaproteobacteria bacterium]
MSKKRYRIPSTSALQAFESAASHCNFSRAAEQLHTSQSAISRHISNLEAAFNTRLFDRHQKKRLILTSQGEQLYRAVVSGLDNIQAAIDTISGTSTDDQLTIACTHEISHLYLLPRFDRLQQAVGKDKPIRIMTYEYDTMETSLDPRIDVVIQYDVSGVDPADRVRIVGEAVRPVASPAFIEQHQQVLAGDVSGWRALPFLDLSKYNYGWATWNDWFEATSNPGVAPKFEYFSNYVYLLEAAAAAAGKGLALGWQVLVERHLQTG